MKIASFDDGSRDGQLMVLSDDLRQAAFAPEAATTARRALDDWTWNQPRLQGVAEALNQGRWRHGFAFDQKVALSALPRPSESFLTFPASQGIDPRIAPVTSRLLRTAGEALATLPTDARDASIYRVALTLVCDDLAAGSSPADALEAVRLLGFSLLWFRHDDPSRAQDANAMLGARTCPAFVTPDSLGEAWRAGRLDRWLEIQVEGRRAARIRLSEACGEGAGQWLARLCADRPLHTGTLVQLQLAPEGTEFPVVRHDQRLRLDIRDDDGETIFGAIDRLPQDAPIEAAGNTTEEQAG